MNQPPSTSFVVVGSINVDLTAHVARLPQAGETIGGGALSRAAGGKGANQAAAAARLGAQVRMIGAVGDDDDGRWSVTALRNAGVDVTGIQVVDEPTGVALIGVDSAAENQIIVCPGANGAIDPSQIRVGPDDTVLTQLEIDMDLVLALVAAKPAFLVVNAAPARALPDALIEHADLFIVNETEYALIPELHHARRVAVTYGGDGAAMFYEGVETARVPAVRATPVNTVGAGDSFCAALALGLRRGMNDTQALRTSCAVGAAAVEDPASQPRFQRLEAYAARVSSAA